MPPHKWRAKLLNAFLRSIASSPNGIPPFWVRTAIAQLYETRGEINLAWNQYLDALKTLKPDAHDLIEIRIFAKKHNLEPEFKAEAQKQLERAEEYDDLIWEARTLQNSDQEAAKLPLELLLQIIEQRLPSADSKDESVLDDRRDALRVLARANNDDSGLAHWREILAMERPRAQDFADAGTAAANLGNERESRDIFERGLKNSGYTPGQFHFQFGQALLMFEDYAEAATEFRAALKKNWLISSSWENLARAEAALGNSNAALDALKQAVTTDDALSVARLRALGYLASQHRSLWPESLPLLEQAIRMAQEDDGSAKQIESLHRMIGWALINMEQPAEARTVFEKTHSLVHQSDEDEWIPSSDLYAGLATTAILTKSTDSVRDHFANIIKYQDESESYQDAAWIRKVEWPPFDKDALLQAHSIWEKGEN